MRLRPRSVTLTNPVAGPSGLQRDHSSVSTSTSGASASTTPVKVTVTTPIAGPSGLQKERSSSVSTSGASTASATTPKAKQKNRPPKQLLLYGTNVQNELFETRVSAINRKLVKMITKDYQPVSIVENEGFQEYSHEMQPLYKLPSRKTLTNDMLPKIYRESADNLRSVLQNVDYCAITSDIWTSDSNRAYLTATMHYIYNDKLCAHVLNTSEIIGSHTNIKKYIYPMENY